MSSRLQTDEALEKEDRRDLKKVKHSPPIPHLLQAQQAPALPYAKVAGCPGTGSYPALLPGIRNAQKKNSQTACIKTYN